MRIYPIAYWLLLCGMTSGCAPTARALPAEVILIRHAEKPPDPENVHLSKAGEERAQALAGFLTTSPALTNLGPPTVLYATDWSKRDHGRRPYETLEPLGKRLHCRIRHPYMSEDYAKLAHHILTSRQCEGQVVVVCWVHDFLPQLAEALGVRPKPLPWKGHVYDRVWRITWPDGHAEMRELRQPPIGPEY
jgi:hypothetical protein